jgi:transcription initiation factor IIE alpha subunit
MKKPDTTELKKIAYNCKKATYLIEKQQLAKITLREQMELKIHLAGCSICVTFMQQSAVINQMARKIFHPHKDDLRLQDDFKVQLQKRINDQLDKK